jgi:putative hydrolase of HD superfamily
MFDSLDIPKRMAEQLSFIVEIDKLKGVLRNTLLIDASRRENDVEHSWHLAVMAILLAEYAEQPIDVLKVIKMVLVHDVVEIDAGDAIVYDEKARAEKADLEQKASERIFALLPQDQAGAVRNLWVEFEARTTPEAKFAAALDRLQPIMHNYLTQGAAWQKHGVTLDQVLKRNAHIAEGSSTLWQLVQQMVMNAADKGYVTRGK